MWWNIVVAEHLSQPYNFEVYDTSISRLGNNTFEGAEEQGVEENTCTYQR
jgi:hypothetical protein